MVGVRVGNNKREAFRNCVGNGRGECKTAILQILSCYKPGDNSQN